MQSWRDLQRDLLPHGFKAAIYVAFTCTEHGRFRAAIQDLPARYPCPTCQQPCKAVYLARSITRRPLPVVEQAGLLKPPHRMPAHIIRPAVAKAKPPKPSQFEREAKKLGLDAQNHESLIASAQLRAWAKAHRRHEYIPEWLLDTSRLSVFEKDIAAVY